MASKWRARRIIKAFTRAGVDKKAHLQRMRRPLQRNGRDAPAADQHRPVAVGKLAQKLPARPCSPSIFRDKKRRDIGKSQSIWAGSK
eukprot:COSAG01_NODE_59696_length_299_cov_0.310000_1_plen_86_part_10